MKYRILLVGIMFLGTAFCGWRFAAAQNDLLKSSEADSTRTAPTATPSDEDEPILIDTELVNVLFTAQDNDRRLLTELKKEDIRILEDGKAQEIVDFTRRTDLPLSLAILIDTSVSMERVLPDEKEAANTFVENVIRPDKDEAAILSFTGETTLEQGMTSNLSRLRRAIDRVRIAMPEGYIGGGVIMGTPPSNANPALGSTAIWDALWITSEEVLLTAPENTRRVIILLTDGVNTYGQKKLDDAVNSVIKADAVIYAIGIGDNFHEGVDEIVLKKITERSGGRAFFPVNEKELREAFDQIQIEMRSQYLLSYSPENQERDGTFRKIEIQISRPQMTRQKIKLTHRQGYFAKTEKQPQK